MKQICSAAIFLYRNKIGFEFKKSGLKLAAFDIGSNANRSQITNVARFEGKSFSKTTAIFDF